MKVYLDNAASTPLDPEVLDHMLPVWKEQQGNPSSVHHHGRILRASIEVSRKTIAELLGAAPSEIFFTSGGTEADNLAIRGSVKGLGIDHIISCKIEHHAVTHPIEELEAEGMKVTWLPVDKLGRISLNDLEEALKQTAKPFVSLMHANNELGTLADIYGIGTLCEKYGAIYHSDTVQSMGNVRYNLSELPVHFITGAAHKFYGPKGVGFIYIKSGVKIPPQITGGAQERNMRAGTENPAGIVGMAFALKKCYDNLDAKTTWLRELKYYMKEKLEALVPGVKFNGDTDPEGAIPTVLNTCFPGEGTESMMLFNLDINGISASGGSACTSGSVVGSHVLNGIGATPVESANSVRFSFGVQNTKEEIDYTISKLEEIFEMQKAMTG